MYYLKEFSCMVRIIYTNGSCEIILKYKNIKNHRFNRFLPSKNFLKDKFSCIGYSKILSFKISKHKKIYFFENNCDIFMML